MSSLGWFSLTAARSIPFEELVKQKAKRDSLRRQQCSTNESSGTRRDVTPSNFSAISRADVVRTLYKESLRASSRLNTPGPVSQTEAHFPFKQKLPSLDAEEGCQTGSKSIVVHRVPDILRTRKRQRYRVVEVDEYTSLDQVPSSHLPESEQAVAMCEAASDGWVLLPKSAMSFPVDPIAAVASMIGSVTQGGIEEPAATERSASTTPTIVDVSNVQHHMCRLSRVPSNWIPSWVKEREAKHIDATANLQRAAAARRKSAQKRAKQQERQPDSGVQQPHHAPTFELGLQVHSQRKAYHATPAVKEAWISEVRTSHAEPTLSFIEIVGKQKSGAGGKCRPSTAKPKPASKKAAAENEIPCEPWAPHSSTPPAEYMLPIRSPPVQSPAPREPVEQIIVATKEDRKETPAAAAEDLFLPTREELPAAAEVPPPQLDAPLPPTKEASLDSDVDAPSLSGTSRVSLRRASLRSASSLAMTTVERGHAVRRSSSNFAFSLRSDPQVEKVGKYKWLFEQLLDAPMLPRVQFFQTYIDSVQSYYTETVRTVPVDFVPVKKHALIIAVSQHDDFSIPPYSQADMDAIACENVLLRAGFTVVSLRSCNVDTTRRPTLANVTREVARVVRWNDAGHYASLVIFFIGRGMTRNVLLMSDSVVRLMACEDSKPNLPHTYFPVDFPVSRRFTNCITVADIAGISGSVPLHGYAFVHNETLGGCMSLEYSQLQPHPEWISAMRGVVSLLFIKALRGKGSCDLRLTPNSINVFICERLMAQKMRVFTNSSPLQNGRWDLIEQRKVFALRKALRAFRLTKRKSSLAIRVHCFITEEYSRNLNTVASLIKTRLKSSTKCRMQTEELSIQTIFMTGQVHFVFHTSDSFTFGCIAAEAFCRRNFSNVEPVRQSSTLRVQVQLPQQGLPGALSKIHSHIRSKSLPVTLFVGVEMHVLTTQRGERKLQWLMRLNRLLPFAIIDAIEIDAEQVRRLRAIAMIQKCWREHVLQKRAWLTSMLVTEREQSEAELMAELRALHERVRRILNAGSRELLLDEEKSARSALEENHGQSFWRLSREYVSSWAAVILRGKSAYQAARPCTFSERLSAPRWSDPDEGHDQVIVRNRKAIEYQETREKCEIEELFARDRILVYEDAAFKPLAQMHVTATQEEFERMEHVRLEHETLLAIVGGIRRYLVIPPRLVKAVPFTI